MLIIRNHLIFIFLFFMATTFLFASELWCNFDSRQWVSEGFGGEAPASFYDSTRFSGKTTIRVSFTGTGSYGFIRTNYFRSENWSTITAIKADVYYEDSFSSNTNNPTSKFEAKNASGQSYEFLVQYLAKNSWQTITWPLRSQSSTASYSTVSWVLFNVESFLGFSAMTAYFDNVRLVYNDGHSEPWESFDGDFRTFNYGGSFDTTRFAGTPYEVVSHTHTSPDNPSGAGYLGWSWSSSNPTYAEIAAINLSNGAGEDWSQFSTVRYDIYASNTSARYKIFMWDGSSGYAPVSQFVTQSNTWTRLQFDISSSTIVAANPSFNRAHIDQFKCVVEYLDVPGANSGEAWFDNIIRMQAGPTSVENWLFFE